MVRKKSSYAAKHTEKIAEDFIFSASFINENKDLLEILRQPHEFDKKFLRLPYARQIAMLDLFHNLSNGNLVISPRKIRQKLLNLTYDCLEHIHWMTGAYYEAGNAYYPIADDEKKLVRMECYGTIDARREHELSPCYKFFRKKENCGQYRLKDYNLMASPMWRVINQFEGFRSIAPNVRRYFYKKGINPDALKVMSVSDFCDVIHHAYASSDDHMKARFLPAGYKNKFVMSFMRHCGKDLENHLIEKGIDERKVKSLCRVMRLYGLCDIERVTITENRFTKRVLDDLSQHGYDVASEKVGDLIPEKLIEKVFDNYQENLLQARDENGLPLTKDDLPRYEVHHKNAVKFAHYDDYLAKVNYFNNLMLVEKEIHRAYYHGFDHIIQVNSDNERYFSRINCTIPEMCMIDGFQTATDIFFYDLEHNPSARRRVQIDRQNVVNYYDMQYERLNNIQEIANQYGIEYSKTDLNNEYKSLQELTQFKVGISKSEIKQFEEWFASPSKTKSKKNKHFVMPKNGKGNER